MEKQMEKSYSNNEILDFLSENGIISIEDVEKQMLRKEIERVISENHKYSIYQGTDGRWRTYIMESGERKLIVKSDKEKLNTYLYKLYKKEDDKKITLKDFYPEWLEYKSLHTSAPTYIYRIERYWKRYYLKDPIIGIPISKLDKIFLDKWAHRLVKENGLTKKTYYNITLIIRQALDYAVDLELIDSNPFTKFKMDSRLFAYEDKKPSFQEVYSIEETAALKAYAMKCFKDGVHHNQPLIPLAILFQLQTGVRLGELRALMPEDIDSDRVIISKFIRNEPGELVKHTKGLYGIRTIFLTEEAKKIVNMALEKKKELAKDSTPFLFSILDTPLSSSTIDYAYYKYCNDLGFFKKSSHKARKTVISSLIDSGMNINTIREIAGHKDERTTYKSYCYDRNTDDRNLKLMNEALK